VRAAAARTAAVLCSRAAQHRPALLAEVQQLLQDPRFEVVLAAIHTTAKLAQSTAVLEVLRPLYIHPNRRVRVSLTRALRQLRERRVLPSPAALQAEQQRIFIPGGIRDEDRRDFS